MAHLRRCEYGTRDAGQIWEDVYAGVLTKMGFRRGLANPCCFYHESRQISVVVHGYDFTALGGRRELQWYADNLKESFEIKIKGHLGESSDCAKEVRVLNRIASIDEDGV